MAEPTCTTEAPHTIGKTYATLTGVLVNDGGHACVYRFWYQDYKIRTWHTTPWQSAGAPGSTFSAVVTVARPHNSYDYYAQVANEDGQDDGLVVWFWFRWKSPPHDGSPFLAYNVTIVGPWDSWVITMRTDISCHLTLHVDNNVPYRKTGEHFKRGIVYMHTPLTFFTPEWHLDQQETGDSRDHTFLWNCKTPYARYTIQATGTVDGRLSPSKSPFFYFKCKPAPPPVPTSDKCLGPWAGWHFAQWWNAAGQTFCPDHSYALTRLHLGLNQYELTRKGWLRVMITRPGGTCWTEPVLWSTELWSGNLPPPKSYTWFTLNVPNLPLTKDTWYRIVVYAFAEWAAFYNDSWHWAITNGALAMWHGNDPDCYTRGTMVYNCDFWRSKSGYRDSPSDLLFQCDEAPSE